LADEQLHPRRIIAALTLRSRDAHNPFELRHKILGGAAPKRTWRMPRSMDDRRFKKSRRATIPLEPIFAKLTASSPLPTARRLATLLGDTPPAAHSRQDQ
jgi:hypothetical protein